MVDATLRYSRLPLGPGGLREGSFDDPQDALVWLWNQAEAVPEDAEIIEASIDGKEVTL